MRSTLLALATSLVSVPAVAAPSDAAGSPLDGFDAHVEQIIHDWNVPGVAVSIVRDGKPVLVKGYGVRDPATGQPMTEETIFPIGSMSKAFTSFSAGLLVDEGKLSLDAPAATYIKGLKFYDAAATASLSVRDMLTHRSGLPRHDAIWFHNSRLSRDELLNRLPYLEPTAPLRSGFNYNNIMFVLAGITVEKIAGQPWESFVEQRIFQPLDMHRSIFGYARAIADPNHTGGREFIRGKDVNVGLFHMSPIVNPAGGIYSDARDLTNWMIMQLDNGKFEGRQIIQPATLDEMHRTQISISSKQTDPEVIPVGYGMGWFTSYYRDHYRLYDPGEINGSTTIINLLPAEKLGVIVLVNHGTSELPDALSREILDRFLGTTGKDWVGEALKRKQAFETEQAKTIAKQPPAPRNGKSSHPIADYSGQYSSPAYGPLTIAMENGRLVGRFGDDSSPLLPQQYDVFTAEPADPESTWRGQRIQFESDFDGRISEARMVVEPALPPASFERLPDARLSDPAYLNGLAGTYLLDGDNVVVTVLGTKLMWQFPNGTPSQLLPALGGEFAAARSRDWRIVFRTDASGRATEMDVTTGDGTYQARRVN